jgi:hypothetical protein
VIHLIHFFEGFPAMIVAGASRSPLIAALYAWAVLCEIASIVIAVHYLRRNR